MRLRGIGSKSIVLLGLFVMVACGGGGGGSSDNGGDSTQGIGLPSEISAISVDNGGGAGRAVPHSSAARTGLAGAFADLSSAIASLPPPPDVPATSDYYTVKPSKYVDEPTLQVFGIVETILKAISQTHYADAANVGAGPYASMIAWYEERDGKTEKSLQKWTVDSTLDAGGVNVVKVWIDDPREQSVIKAVVRITQAPSQAADGTFLDYGKWVIQANPQGGIFYADADIDAVTGETILRMKEISGFENTFYDVNAGNAPVVIRVNRNVTAYVHKSNTAGYGYAAIPNEEMCWSYPNQGIENSPCLTGAVDGEFTLPTPDVRYAYDADFLALDQYDDGDNLVSSTYKQRLPVDVPYAYGIYDSTGRDVSKVKTFGFPITYNNGTFDLYGYYGAWQGHHNIWAGNDGLPDGAQVAKENYGNPGAAPETFTVKNFDGTLSKRTLIDGALSQIEGIPLEIWIGRGMQLQYIDQGAGYKWYENTWDPTANGGFGNMVQTEFTNFDSITYDPTRVKNIWIGGPSGQQLYYQGGFKVMAGPEPADTDLAFTPTPSDNLFVNISGRTYIEYSVADGWREKNMAAFDTATWTPTFDGYRGAFELPMGQEYYVNNKGVNFVIKKIVGGTVEVKIEQQTVARPDNAATFLSGVAYLASPWEDPSSRSKFELDTDPGSPNYMLLVYKFVGANDTGKNVGDVVQKGCWGLAAFNASDANLGTQFNWGYAGDGGSDSWAKSTYLIRNTDDTFVYLANPVSFDPINLGGINYALNYDGWLHGLPDIKWELQKNGYLMTPELAAKVVTVPDGTELTETGTGLTYFIKATQVGAVLPTLDVGPETPPDMTAANALVLDLTPTALTDADIGATPDITTIKYVEGIAQ